MTDTNSKEGERDRSANNRSETRYIVEKGSVDEVITDREIRVDENEVFAESTEKKTKQNHSRNISKYDPSLNLPIALWKGTRFCTKHSISDYVL